MQNRNTPSYVGASVCKDWHSFMTFRAWMMQQDWKNKHLDKDIVNPGNKEYNPENCRFVTRALNNLLLDNAHRRGKWPQGVYVYNGSKKMAATLSINGKHKIVGVFDTCEEAQEAYKTAKIAYIRSHQSEQTDLAIINGLELHIKNIESAKT